MKTTKIAGRYVPIEPGPTIVINFSAGHEGTAGAGSYAFWASVVSPLGDCVRWPAGKDPGERFRIMQGAPGYEAAWERSRRAKRIRPAMREEVELWLNSHLEDARHATTGELGGAKVRVVSEGGRYRFIQDAP